MRDQRRNRAEGGQLRHEKRADHADRERNVNQRLALFVLDDDATNVALVYQFLYFGDQHVAAHLELFGSNLLLAHGFLPFVKFEMPL